MTRKQRIEYLVVTFVKIFTLKPRYTIREPNPASPPMHLLGYFSVFSLERAPAHRRSKTKKSLQNSSPAVRSSFLPGKIAFEQRPDARYTVMYAERTGGS